MCIRCAIFWRKPKSAITAVKTDAQAIYQAENRKQAACWPALLPTLATELSQPGATTGTRPAGTALVLRLTPVSVEEVTNHQHQLSAASWKSEVRRRTRPMVCFVNVQSVDRIIYSIFQRFNLEWKNRTLQVFTTRSLTGTMNNIRRAATA
jgi:transposase-like protein